MTDLVASRLMVHHGAAKLDGFLYEVVNHTDKTLSKAYFATAQSGATVYNVTRGTSGKFDTLGSPL